jgi:hypothetical protein
MNLIVGAATNSRWNDTLIFFSSLAATSFTGRVALFCTDQWQVPAGLALPFTVDIVDITEKTIFRGPLVWRMIFKGLSRTNGIRRWYPVLLRQLYKAPASQLRAVAEAGDWAFSHPANLRYLAFNQWLASATEVENVMLTDVRDVAFQADPFVGLDPDKLTVAAEEPHIIFGDDLTNTMWMTQCYGKEVARIFKGKAVLCSGTTLGGIETIREYLALMRVELERHRGPVFGRDQAAHNIVVSNMRQASIVRNRQGLILTMGRMSGYRRNDDWTVLNDDGSIPAVVHQYDRHPALLEAWSKKFALGAVPEEVPSHV